MSINTFCSIASASSMIANTIPVLSRYCHNMVLAVLCLVSVWYCHDTDSGDFEKTLKLSLYQGNFFQPSLIFC